MEKKNKDASLASPALAGRFLTTAPLGKPQSNRRELQTGRPPSGHFLNLRGCRVCRLPILQFADKQTFPCNVIWPEPLAVHHCGCPGEGSDAPQQPSCVGFTSMWLSSWQSSVVLHHFQGEGIKASSRSGSSPDTASLSQRIPSAFWQHIVSWCQTPCLSSCDPLHQPQGPDWTLMVRFCGTVPARPKYLVSGQGKRERCFYNGIR